MPVHVSGTRPSAETVADERPAGVEMARLHSRLDSGTWEPLYSLLGLDYYQRSIRFSTLAFPNLAHNGTLPELRNLRHGKVSQEDECRA